MKKGQKKKKVKLTAFTRKTKLKADSYIVLVGGCRTWLLVFKVGAGIFLDDYVRKIKIFNKDSCVDKLFVLRETDLIFKEICSIVPKINE